MLLAYLAVHVRLLLLEAADFYNVVTFKSHKGERDREETNSVSLKSQFVVEPGGSVSLSKITGYSVPGVSRKVTTTALLLLVFITGTKSCS